MIKVLNVTSIEKYLPDLFYELTLKYKGQIKKVITPELWWLYRKKTVLNTVMVRWNEFPEI